MPVANYCMKIGVDEVGLSSEGDKSWGHDGGSNPDPSHFDYPRCNNYHVVNYYSTEVVNAHISKGDKVFSVNKRRLRLVWELAWSDLLAGHLEIQLQVEAIACANASAVAMASAKSMLKKRINIFNALDLPEVGTARISNFMPLCTADGTSAIGYGFVWFNQRVMLGKVSNIPIQVYEHFVGKLTANTGDIEKALNSLRKDTQARDESRGC
ncbi:hypothetical protein BDQ17DRAFT_1332648 [Cyathus striatus]|nr:hypothetical protein BDQ17DRAFT_1332648 [Cyathus striatus]